MTMSVRELLEYSRKCAKHDALPTLAYLENLRSKEFETKKCKGMHYRHVLGL